MCDLVSEHYAVLQIMSRFSISLGFGDRTIGEVCADHRVDASTFLAVVNLLIGNGQLIQPMSDISVATLTQYLKNAHRYFLDFRLPSIRRKLIEAIDCSLSDVSFAIMRYYDEYVAEVQKHMAYEEQTVFPYVESLLEGKPQSDYSIEIFRSLHETVADHLKELKQIIIKYYPTHTTDELNDALFDIFTCEQELTAHNRVEDELFISAIEELAARVELAPKQEAETESLSAREKEIIVCVVKGLTNKEIADELYISTHTVITHRRNIASKLQIHSAAGLTIYAIVNKLVDLSEIKETITRE
ncbi:MAG: helix-turn-helix transcriptional regulator [Alistipes sp.]|nr:helix-turn-helix transcriptional regulator [Alistipes sp.]